MYVIYIYSVYGKIFCLPSILFTNILLILIEDSTYLYHQRMKSICSGYFITFKFSCQN